MNHGFAKEKPNPAAIHPHWIVLLAFCLLASCKWLALYEKPLDYDSAYFGAVAKNVVNGFGYATSHSVKMPFNPEITTGPAVIFPLALLITTFGNLDILPDLYIVTINLLLVAIFSILFLKRFGNTWHTAGFLLCLYLWSLLYEPHWWIICIGDQQVLLVMLIASLLISSRELLNKPVNSGILGFVAGFGILVKFSFLVALPALLLAFVINGVRFRIPKSAFALFMLTLAMTLSPFYIYKAHAIANMSPDEKQSLQANSLSAGSMRQAAGVGIFLETPEKMKHIQKSAKRSHAVLRNLFNNYNVPMFAVYAILVLPLLFSLATLRKSFSQGVAFGTLVGWICSCFTLWYFLFCLALQSKYSLPSVWLSAVFLLFIAYAYRGIALPLLLLLLWPLAMSADVRTNIFRGYLPNTEKLAYKTATEETVRFLNAHTDRPALAYCGWASIPRSIMYLLPESEVMPDCYKAIGDSLFVNPENALSWKQPVQYWLIKDKQISGLFPKEAARFDVMRRTCNTQPLFDNAYYQILDCPWDKLKTLEQQPALLKTMQEFIDPLV